MEIYSMSGMHLLPVYYTTTNHKKRKKKVNRSKYEAACIKHNKFLKRYNLGPQLSLQEYIDNVHGKVTFGSKTLTELSVSSYERASLRSKPDTIPSVSLAFKSNPMEGCVKERPYYTGEAVIGQAYNKGGMQVLTPEEVRDPMTGKRR